MDADGKDARDEQLRASLLCAGTVDLHMHKAAKTEEEETETHFGSRGDGRDRAQTSSIFPKFHWLVWLRTQKSLKLILEYTINCAPRRLISTTRRRVINRSRAVSGCAQNHHHTLNPDRRAKPL